MPQEEEKEKEKNVNPEKGTDEGGCGENAVNMWKLDKAKNLFQTAIWKIENLPEHLNKEAGILLDRIINELNKVHWLGVH